MDDRSSIRMIDHPYMDDKSSIWMIDHPYMDDKSSIWMIDHHMDDLSSIWMIYHAAADAAATIGEMYLRESIFEKNGPEKMTLFLEIKYFSNRAGSMIARTAPFLQSFSMRNCLKLFFC